MSTCEPAWPHRPALASRGRIAACRIMSSARSAAAAWRWRTRNSGVVSPVGVVPTSAAF